MNDRKPVILFLCQHNAGRSQLGAGVLEHLAGDRYTPAAAGLAPAEQLNPRVAASLAELGVEAWPKPPRAVTAADIDAADVVVAMKPGLALPATPKHLVEWRFPDPSSWELDGVRPLRDDIAASVSDLLAELEGSAAPVRG